MIDPRHLLHYVIRPVLRDLRLWSTDAERLVLGTACQESECGRWLKQIGGGPALGIYQCEPASHDDIWSNYLAYEPALKDKVKNYMPIIWTGAQLLVGNLSYATIICRIHYLRVSDEIPDYLGGQASYWKQHYNTEKGEGTTQEYMNAWNRCVAPKVFAEDE